MHERLHRQDYASFKQAHFFFKYIVLEVYLSTWGCKSLMRSFQRLRVTSHAAHVPHVDGLGCPAVPKGHSDSVPIVCSAMLVFQRFRC